MEFSVVLKASHGGNTSINNGREIPTFIRHRHQCLFSKIPLVPAAKPSCCLYKIRKMAPLGSLGRMPGCLWIRSSDSCQKVIFIFSISFLRIIKNCFVVFHEITFNVSGLSKLFREIFLRVF